MQGREWKERNYKQREQKDSGKRKKREKNTKKEERKKDNMPKRDKVYYKKEWMWEEKEKKLRLGRTEI